MYVEPRQLQVGHEDVFNHADQTVQFAPPPAWYADSLTSSQTTTTGKSNGSVHLAVFLG